MAENDPTAEEHFVVRLAKENQTQIACLRKVVEDIVAALGGTVDWAACSASIPPPP